ncbi:MULTISPECIES: hypothetical protein [Halanaerobium]|uniref:Uncharacterized protein n=1 Tax=Halanaerobium kushneri TaxID=56779 RepID=A0A1N6PD31_9FIRM|nr:MULTISPECIES: hypothetical protein [Halanaerobium]RCW58740.1 hypothetical protein DFR80_10977 [Halanaerobium sp. ST460_2HS_T2]SIQ02243.1 hypothetical protein SAMN05421834_10144 [Halanaerobium kushneri]
MMYNQDQFIIKLGRKATISGLIGFLCGLIAAFLLSFSIIAIAFTAIIFSFFFTSAFWGIHNLKMWFNKYRYRMPEYLWYFLNIFVYLGGVIVGLIGYGFIEHFLLLLAMDQHKKGTGLIGAQIILLPYLGKIYADKINYNI